jgi:hypothetical protein
MKLEQWPTSTLLELYLTEILAHTDSFIHTMHESITALIKDGDSITAHAKGTQLHPVIRRRRTIVKELRDIRRQSGRSTQDLSDLPLIT